MSTTPMVEEELLGGSANGEPRVSRWVFSTDGVGFPTRAERVVGISTRKRWVEAGDLSHPAMFGIGPGVEENTHKIAECIDSREMAAAISFLANYPSVLRRCLAGVPDVET